MDTFNFREPQPGEIQDIQQRVTQRRLALQRYRVLSQLLAGKKDVDITTSPEIFEALNREQMEFETIMNLPQNKQDILDTLAETKQDRAMHTDGKYWNPQSHSKTGCLGNIPKCVYFARPLEYWKDKKILREFFNMFPKFRVYDKRV